MCISFKSPIWTKSLFIFVLGLSSLLPALSASSVEAQEAAGTPANSSNAVNYEVVPGSVFCGLMISQASPLELKNNADICSKDNKSLSLSKTTIRKIKVVLTGYSSTVDQTDDTPFITANGTYVHDGIIANNGLPFGTQIRIPELYGNKVFSVEDRMHWRMGDYNFDIWFPTYEQAKDFGVKYAYVEVLEK